MLELAHANVSIGSCAPRLPGKQMERLLLDSGVAAVVCGERWTSVLLRLVREGKGAALRLLVQREPLRYDELILKETLPEGCPLKLHGFEFVERMGDCQRLPPCPSPASALATIM